MDAWSIVAIIAAAALLVLSGYGWSRFLAYVADRWSEAEHGALPPRLRQAGCSCSACRRLPSEPCSDYDGD